MPIDFTIDHPAKRVVARAHGAVSLADVLAYFDAIMVENAGRYPKLFDAREATFELSDDDMMVVGARASLYATFSPGPTAFVLDPTPGAAGNASIFIRRYQNLARGGREMELFDSRDRAEQWLWNAGDRED
jgi:hypothetical protein